MPYMNLAAPQRIETVTGDLCGVATLDSASLVAMLSHSPATCAILPFFGGTKRNVKLALSSVDDVAFLSRDVLAVRSGTEVWSAIGITRDHINFNLVTSNARALYGTPAGGRALVLANEGAAVELALGDAEVTARSFLLRGDVKLAAIDSRETAVVGETGGALEMRIHPGPTPEPGARTRIGLPGGTTVFDRLATGPALRVLYKKDRHDACIVQRHGSGLSAKMVDVGAPIGCAAVSETSLVVAYKDGRVALFDGATLAAAQGDSIVPTHTLPLLGARGEPSSMFITTKGSALVWVGTTMGDIIKVALVHK